LEQKLTRKLVGIERVTRGGRRGVSRSQHGYQHGYQRACDL